MPFATGHVDFRNIDDVVPLDLSFRGSIPSTFWLTACRLAVLRLISEITPLDPRTRYPVTGQSSGAGFTPAKICDLARPHRWLIFEKTPLFVITFLFSIICIFAQGEAVQSLDNIPLSLRLSNVFISYSQYLSQTIWPSHLAVFYPYPASYPIWQVAGSVLLLSSLSVILICKAKKYPLHDRRMAVVHRHPCTSHRTGAGGVPSHGGSIHLCPAHWSVYHRGLGSPESFFKKIPFQKKCYGRFPASCYPP